MKYNKTAFIIMLVAILGSSLITGVTQMSSIAKQANNYFVNGGSDKDNFSIYNDLQDKTGVCENLLALASNYISASDSHIKEIQNAMAKIKETKDVSDLYAANSKLDSNVSWLVAELKNKNLSKTHEDMLYRYESQYHDEVVTIGYDASTYNLMVKNYYDETAGIPGILFRLFVKNPEYYR